MKLKTLGIASLLAICSATSSVMAGDNEKVFSDGSIDYQSVKGSPEVTFDKVQEIFGFNLDNATGIKEMLLLAIGMDHTTPGSPNLDQMVGIPYIVDKGPHYWINRFASGDTEIEVLVNNALILLFGKDNNEKADNSARKLLQAAANSGYWPADFYIAEDNLTTKLSTDFSLLGENTSFIGDANLKELATETMERFSNCAGMGFAPCQYRLGFWLSSSPEGLKGGMEALRTAIKTTLADTRYQGVMDTPLILAAKEIVMKGDYVGIDSLVREEYLNLMKAHMASLQQDLNSKTQEMTEEIKAFLKNT
ncbi:hypothetical protein [Oleiphilus sp. HI0132]|uniref:hypothetical protein n=1 Tax=Oleiphilus sp. HI0132 TaxID=1822270 RepID=UPI000B135BD6|nr:hypothetical protein [Oleiphilus sp. HI0132]